MSVGRTHVVFPPVFVCCLRGDRWCWLRASSSSGKVCAGRDGLRCGAWAGWPTPFASEGERGRGRGWWRRRYWRWVFARPSLDGLMCMPTGFLSSTSSAMDWLLFGYCQGFVHYFLGKILKKSLHTVPAFLKYTSQKSLFRNSSFEKILLKRHEKPLTHDISPVFLSISPGIYLLSEFLTLKGSSRNV